MTSPAAILLATSGGKIPIRFMELPLPYASQILYNSASKEGCDPVLLNRPAGPVAAFFRPAGFICQPQFVMSGIIAEMSENGKEVPMGGGKSKEVVLSGQEELILKVTKEIMVKFIEIGRISTTNFEDTFKLVNDTVRQSLK